LEGKIDTTIDFVGKHQTFQDAQHIRKFTTTPPLVSPYLAATCYSNADHHHSPPRGQNGVYRDS
jgi:hypothetical protein